MKKPIVILGIIAVLVAVSCAFMGNDSAENNERDAVFVDSFLHQEKTKLSKIPDARETSNRGTTPQGPVPTPQKILSHYDSLELDEKVRAEAKNFNRDSNTYRMLVRSDADGAKVYRMIGMHVIVSPMGEETFLPDEI